MKLFTTIAVPVLLSFLAIGCGGSSSKKTDEPFKEAHNIQPSDVPAYIANFKKQKSELKYTLGGENSPISLVEMLMDDKLLIVKINSGIALIGFDFDQNMPNKEISIFEGDNTDIEKLLEEPTRKLVQNRIELTESGDNFVLTGTVIDETTTGLFNVQFVINESLLTGGTSQFVVDGDSAVVTGDLGTQAYIQVQDIIDNSPNVKRLVLQNISGSVNDAINLHTGRLVRNAEMTTIVPFDGDINSGGVDLFAAGFKRIYTTGGKVGVHSWCCVKGKSADKLSKDNSAHGAQLTFVREMLGEELGPDFYFFTLSAASFDSIHVMTKAELDKYLISK